MGKVESLPKWAQDRIALLERNEAYWRGIAAARATGATGMTQSVVGERVPINDFPTNWTLADGTEVQVRFDDGNKQLAVSTVGRISSRLKVLPVSSNFIYLKGEDY